MKLISRTVLLVVLNTVVLLGGGLVSYMALSHKIDVSIPPPKSGEAARLTAPRVAPIDDNAIMSKPIFRRSRQALEIDNTTSTIDAKNEIEIQPTPAPLSPTLSGILRDEDGQSWALLEGNGGASRQLLAKGGNFEGWRVIRIDAKDATLHHLESKIDIQVHLPNSSVGTSTTPK
jgi:hypothetical protein